MSARGPARTRELSPFDRAVAAVVRSIPVGETLSYAGVSRRAGEPYGARAVVQALKRLPEVPWWRVIRSDGTLAPEVVAEQAPRLRAEGVRVVGRRVHAKRDTVPPGGPPARKRDTPSTSGGRPARKRDTASTSGGRPARKRDTPSTSGGPPVRKRDTPSTSGQRPARKPDTASTSGQRPPRKRNTMLR